MAADPEEAELVAAWRAAVARPDVVGELEALHAAVAEAVARERPICLASGQCCHFERHGHRLYVTGLEAVWCVTNLARRDGPEASLPAVEAARRRGDCPFLLEGRLCGAHRERPLGCRIYFCDRMATDWQRALYEAIHRRLVDLHERHAIPYRYGEWRTMLALAIDPNQ